MTLGEGLVDSKNLPIPDEILSAMGITKDTEFDVHVENGRLVAIFSN